MPCSIRARWTWLSHGSYSPDGHRTASQSLSRGIRVSNSISWSSVIDESGLHFQRPVMRHGRALGGVSAECNYRTKITNGGVTQLTANNKLFFQLQKAQRETDIWLDIWNR
ncbi:hypothetical protein RRG08_033777 [Elysia crispata]|uniref:Uncharacterized protein n=1 Tax=Elysia crispata TaxID=231223 RepID=A0AAE1AU94_9GAST|nr:hypothetical protein RRG08_033777 [Elysia crispata]